MNIKTKRLRICNFTEDNTEALYSIKYDPNVLKYNPDFLERNITRDKVIDYIRAFDAADKNGVLDTKRAYAVVLQDTEEVVGAITIAKNNMLQEYELGWKTLASHTGNGYASEAAVGLCEYVCEKYNIDYIIVVMDTDNPASYHTALKSGFQLFEKRKVYDHSYQNFGDDYYYFRRYYSKSETKEKFYGDAGYTGRGAETEDEKKYAKLIMIRGNSGSGKSTVARMLQKRLGRGTLYIPQDVVRRELLWVKDRPKNKAIALLEEMIRFGHQNCEYTILEGILYSEDYQELFQTAKECFGLQIHAYYYDLPFEETLARHMTKPNRNEFGENEMKEWYLARDFITTIPEKIITGEQSAEAVVEMILRDVGFTAETFAGETFDGETHAGEMK